MVRVQVRCCWIPLPSYPHVSGLGIFLVAETSNGDGRAYGMKPVLLERSPVPPHAMGTVLKPASRLGRDRTTPETRENSR